MNSQTTATTVVAAPALNSGDNAWMITATALVSMMTPASAFFYGGMVDMKYVLNQLFLSCICMGVVCIQWVLFGFSFAFGPSVSSGFGSFGYAALRFNGDRRNAFLTPTYPLLTYAAYQGTFAVLTTALISGATVGRMKLIPYMIFIFIWTTVCYDPVAHWVWSQNGWLKHLGTLDFAGGTVVHLCSGVSGFVASLILGKRVAFKPHGASNAHNLPFTVLGTCLLWVGWTGFNAGSAKAANGIAAAALCNTNAAAAAGLVTWVVLDAIRGQVTISGACAGPIIGLIAVTPAAGYVQPGWSILFGVIPTIVTYFILILRDYLRYDDISDVTTFHTIGGIMGTFMTGLFCQLDYNSGGANGAFYGHPVQLWYQIAGILTTIGYGGACTALILLILKYTIGIRLSPEDEMRGLDDIAHGEKWDLDDRSKKRATTIQTSNRLQLSSYLGKRNSKGRNNRSRSRSKSKRRDQVYRRSDISQTRPDYIRSQLQVENNNQFQGNNSILTV